MIKRSIFHNLKEHLRQKEISLIVGPRQAGKTTVMMLLKDYLEKSGSKTAFLNLDIESDRRFFESQEYLLKKIQLEIGNEGFVFIDEMQRKENAGLFLKGIYDMNLPYKFIVSGSGSLELKEKIHESLVGRKRIFELSTITFDEFVNFKTGYKYENKLSDFFSTEKSMTQLFLKEYLNFGGYPRVVLADTSQEKRRIVDEIYSSYIEKDIHYLLGVKKGEEFTKLFQILASQVGRLVNFSELSSTIGISVKTVKDYIWYLEKTYILQRITPFYKNFRKEITKSPNVYFNDLGLRNYAIGLLGNIQSSQDVGFLFQNFIFNILKEIVTPTPFKIHFWRTKDGAEVDFVIDMIESQIPIEIKYRSLKNIEISRGFRSFLSKYAPRKALVINLSLDATAKIDQTIVRFFPFHQIEKEIILL